MDCITPEIIIDMVTELSDIFQEIVNCLQDKEEIPDRYIRG